MQGVLTQSNLKLEHLPSSVKWQITMAPSDNQNVYHILWSLPRRDEHVARSEPWRRGTWAAAAAIKGRSKVIKVAWPGLDQKWQQSIWSWSWCRPLNHWRFLSKIKLLRLTPSWPVLDCETATSYQCCGHQWLPSFALDIAKCHGNRKNRKGRMDFFEKSLLKLRCTCLKSNLWLRQNETKIHSRSFYSSWDVSFESDFLEAGASPALWFWKRDTRPWEPLLQLLRQYYSGTAGWSDATPTLQHQLHTSSDL